MAIAAAIADHLGWREFGVAALALVVGGVPAAPFAAITVRLEPRPLLMTGVGLLIVLLKLHDLWQLDRTSRIRSNRSSAVNRERPLPGEPSTAAGRPERRNEGAPLPH